jgi:hypothetical protein
VGRVGHGSPRFQKTCDLNTVALLCGTVAAHPKFSLSCRPPPVGTVAPPMPVNAYFVRTLEGQELAKALNGKYLKRYYPSIWQG